MPDNIDKIKQHLSKDTVLKNVIGKVSIDFPDEELSVFSYLIKSIVSQQLSTKAAQNIYNRLLALPHIDRNEPTSFLKYSQKDFRKAGLSFQKSNYVINVCKYFFKNDLLQVNWHQYSDDQLISLFTEIKGVGIWTVQMVLIFGLKRPDVFPVLDLGIRQGMAKLYGLNSEKKDFISQLKDIANNWSPYKSHATLAIWRYKDAK